MSVSYLLSCECGRKIPVQPTQAGQTISCRCGDAIVVPSLNGLRQLPQTTDDTTGHATDHAIKKVKSSGGWDRRRAWITTALVILMLGVSQMIALRIMKPTLSDLNNMSPSRSWGLWNELRRGADRYSPDFEAYADAVRFNRLWTRCAWVTIGVGCVASVAAYVLVRSPPR